MNVTKRTKLIITALTSLLLATSTALACGLHSGPGSRTLPPVTGEQAFTLTIDEVEYGPCPEWFPEGCGLAIIQGDPEKPNADALLRLAPNTVVTEHWHTSAERMIVMAGQMEVDYVGHDPVVAVPGDYLYGPAMLAHTAACLDEGECILFIVFEDPVDAIDAADQPAANPPEPTPFMATIAEAFDGSEIPCPVDESVPTPDWPVGCKLSVIQGLDPDGYNWDALLWIEPDTKIPMHWHTSAERMVLLHGELRVNYHGQAPVVLEPFTYAYGPAQLPHDAVCGDAGECVLFIAFEEPIDAVAIRRGNLPHRRLQEIGRP